MIKKTILMLLVLVGGVMQGRAVTIYLNPKANNVDLTEASAKLSLYYYKSSDNAQNGWDEFTATHNGVYTATLPSGYDRIIIVRGPVAKTFEGKWGQTADLTYDSSKTFYTISSYSDGVLTFTNSAVHKIYVQNKQTSTQPRIHTWGGTYNSNYSDGGFELQSEIIDNETWYVFVTSDSSVNGLFLLTGDSDKTGNITFDLSSSDLYYYYYPTYLIAMLSSDALATPAKLYVQANVIGDIKGYFWNLPDGASWRRDGTNGIFPLTKETINGKDWYTFETPFSTFTGLFCTYNNGDSDNNKSEDYSFSLTAGENAYFFANLSAKKAVSKLESKYYILYTSQENGWIDINDDDPASFVELTKDSESDFVFKGIIDNLNGNNVKFFIAPESAVTISGNVARVNTWNQLFFFDGNGDYEIKWQNMQDKVTTSSWKRWKIAATDVKAKHEFIFNFKDLTFTNNPYLERTLYPAAEGFATFSAEYDVAIPDGITAKYASAVAGGKITWEEFGANGIPAGQGALLEGTAGEEYKFTPATSAEAPSVNLMKAINEKIQLPQTEEGNTNYILTKSTVNGDAVLGFYKVNASGSWCAAGTAYLSVPSQQAPEFIVLGETTGIANVNRENVSDNQYYMLDGRRVAQPTKGLYIVNGKKVVIK